MPASTTSRLLALLSLLQTRRDWPGPVLADRLGVSDRTVRRDVDRLRVMGYRIDADRGSDGGYRLDAGAQLPPLLLDEDQVTALVVALGAVPLLGTGLDEAAERALGTLRRVLPDRLRRRAEALTFDPVPSSTVLDPAVLTVVADAVRSAQVLRIDYGDAGGPARQVEPHRVVTVRGRWYLIAWDRGRADWRLFRVDRLRPRTGTGPRFVRREVPAGLLAARFTGGADGRWPCRGSVILDRPLADLLPYAGEAVVEELPDGRCRITAGSWSWAGLAAWFARYDADVDAPEPVELSEAFHRLGARFTARPSPSRSRRSGSR